MTTPAPDRDLPATRYAGTRIHALLWERRFTQVQVAAWLGIAAPTFSKKLRGDVPITVDELVKIARALGVEPGELLPGSDGEPVTPVPRARVSV